MNHLKLAALSAASLAAISGAAPAHSQAADTPVSGAGGNNDKERNSSQEIVVTAQRRTERVADVPISITVANSEQLERQQVNSFSDLNRIAPSLEIQSAPGQNTGGGGSIRGIGTQTFASGAVASVGVVVDQVSQGNANIGDIFDVARIEVLKGPQGTLFGLTTSAGVINITTNAPDPNHLGVRARTELSNQGTLGSGYGQQVIQGVVNLPISQDAAIRVSGLGNLRQGVNRNAYTGDWNHNDRYAGRARFLWTPADRLTINLIGDLSKATSTGGGDFFTFTQVNAADTAALASCGVTAREGNQDYCQRLASRTTSKNWGVSGEVDYAAEPFTLTSITAYRRSTNTAQGVGQSIFRADPIPLRIIAAPAPSSIDLVTQEFRISSPGNVPLEYTAGAFVSHQRSFNAAGAFNITLTPFPGFTIPIVSSVGARNVVNDDSMALFGQLTYHVTTQLRLIGGGRITEGKLSLVNFDVASAVTRRQQLITDKISYRFGAQYDVAARTMLYATASRGYKGGQISVPALPAQPFIIKPEIPQVYEAGMKSTLFRGWIADLNVFYQKVQNYQAQQCLSDPLTGGLSCVNTNINGVKSKGAELDFFGRVTRQLILNTGFIYTDATYPKNYIGTDGTNIGGTMLAYSPRYKFTLSGEYEQPLSDRFAAFLAADTVWKSRLRYEANSVSQSTFRPHWVVGGRIGLRTADDRFSAAVFARNLFDVHEPVLIQSGFPDGGAANIGSIYGPQSFRQIGLSLDARF